MYNLGDRINGKNGCDFVVTKIDGYLRVIYLPNYAVEKDRHEIDNYSNCITTHRLKEIMLPYKDFEPTYKGENLFDQYCYKVVARQGKEFVSCSVADAKLKYTIGVKTTPEFGKIFVFDTLKNARYFVSRNDKNFVILKCKHSLLEHLVFRSNCMESKENLRKFWFSENCEYYTPQGTFGADWVIPVEVVEC